MIRARNLNHFYGKEQVLFDIDLDLEAGKLHVFTGESGSGKSTLLSILSTLLRPGSGELFFDNTPYERLSNLDALRRERIGFVFQFHYLIEYLNLRENILLASDKKEPDMELLSFLGLDGLLDRLPAELSGGQRQRGALVRALANDPDVLFADEPTGNLDSKNSALVFELLEKIASRGTTVVVATHDRELARRSDRVYEVRDGRI